MARVNGRRNGKQPVTDPVRQLEQAYGKRLEAGIKSAQCLDWADFFNEKRSQQREQVIFGFQGGRVIEGQFNPALGRRTYTEQATFELQVQVYDLANHGAALQLVRFALYRVLTGYKPFVEVEPLTPRSYGDPSYDDGGFWSYGAALDTFFDPFASPLTPVSDDVNQGRIESIKIGLYNERAKPPNDLVYKSEDMLTVAMENRDQ